MTEDALPFSIQLLIRELWSGHYLNAPVSDLAHASYGSSETTTTDQRMFLEEHLARIPAEMLSRYGLPAETHLKEIDVLVPVEGLHRRLQVEHPITFAAVIIPTKEDAWVVIPVLNHTFYVSRKEDLEESITAEIKRMAAIHQQNPWSYLNLLPARSEVLETIEVDVDRSDRGPKGRAASLHRKLIKQKQTKEALEVLHSVGIPLHKRRQPTPLVGLERSQQVLRKLLSGKDRLSVLLLGPELVGKTALFHGWLSDNEGPVFATSGAQLIAGMSGLGQWQERVRRVMEAAELLDAVIFFDNLADLFGDRETSFVDLAGAMRPYLEEGRVRLVGELTEESLDTFENRHASFLSTLARVRVRALGAADAEEALRARIALNRKNEPQRPNLSLDAVQTVIDLLDRYRPYLPFPGKAIQLYEELRAISEKSRNTESGEPVDITESDVLQTFSTQTGIPTFLLREDRALRLKTALSYFQERVIGQSEPIRRVVETVCVVKAGLQPTGKPLATFLFVGPTGVGKTELARTLATFLFGAPDRMVRFDMSEFSDPFAAERLIRGTDRSEGLLTQRIRQQPFSVVLLDEIEKANAAVFDLLLQVSGEGRLTDARGRTAYFHNTIIVMTSNLGAAHRTTPIGIDADSQTSEEYYLRQVNRAFRPELVNRFDRIIAFHELSPEEVQQVARIVLNRMQNRRGLVELGVSLEISDAVIAELAQEGYSETYGARALRRHLEDNLVAPIARILAQAGLDARAATIQVSTDEETGMEGQALISLRASGRCFRLYSGRDRASQQSARGMARIATLRREVEQHLALDTAVQVKEQIAHLLSQLSYGPKDREGQKRDARQIAELMAEHHRLAEVHNRAIAAHEDLLTAEELALTALFSGEDLADYLLEAEIAHTDFRNNLIYVLLCQRIRRDAVTLTLQELDDGRAFDYWLVPFLDYAESRKWLVEIHTTPNEAHEKIAWPQIRPWSPPRTPRKMIETLTKERKRQTLLLRVNGPYAGVLLALEAGLHRWAHVHDSLNLVQMSCQLISLTTAFSDTEWLTEPLQPPNPSAQEISAMRPARHFEGRYNHLTLLSGHRQRRLELKRDQYFERFEQITLSHLLVFEQDDDADVEELFLGSLDRLVSHS